MLSRIEEAVPDSYPVFSYFINSAEYSNKISPFHFVIGIEKKFLEDQYKLSLIDNQAYISDWLADDLNINDDAEVTIDYFITNRNQKLINSNTSLIIKGTKKIDFFTSFKGLIPEFPGFSDTSKIPKW